MDIDDFLAELRSGEKPVSLTTLRSDSNAMAMFCASLTHPGYGSGEFCERTFGDIPTQVCFEWNTPKHTTDDAVPAKRRAFTKAELQLLFDHIDDLVDSEYAAGSKRWLPLFRDPFDRGRLRSCVRPDPGRPLLRLHDWPLRIGIVGLQAEDRAENDRPPHGHPGGPRCLNNDGSAIAGTFAPS